MNRNGGRDHWPRLSTLALAGGGLRMGQVVGQSTDRGESPRSDPVTVENLLGTVLHVLFDETGLRQSSTLPRVVAAALERARPVAALI